MFKTKKSKKIAAIVAAGMMAVSSMAFSASASTPTQLKAVSSYSSGWQLINDITYDSGVVSGLVNGTDTGVTFLCQSYYDRLGTGINAYCDIQSNVKLYPTQGAVLSSVGAKSTCLFASNWYSVSSGRVSFSVTGRNFNSSPVGSQYMNGTAY